MAAGDRRVGVYEPVTPARDGRPPNFAVVCLTCTYMVDAHGETGEDAVKSVTGHDPTHQLTARPLDYTRGWGPKQDAPHPLYDTGERHAHP